MKEIQDEIATCAVQVIVKVKDRNKQTTQKRWIYGEHIKADVTDPQIDKFVSEVQKNFKSDEEVQTTSITLKLK